MTFGALDNWRFRHIQRPLDMSLSRKGSTHENSTASLIVCARRLCLVGHD